MKNMPIDSFWWVLCLGIDNPRKHEVIITTLASRNIPNLLLFHPNLSAIQLLPDLKLQAPGRWQWWIWSWGRWQRSWAPDLLWLSEDKLGAWGRVPDEEEEAEDEELCEQEGFWQEDLVDAMLDMFEDDDEKDLDWLPPALEEKWKRDRIILKASTYW